MIVAVLQARVGSSRLPGKVLADVAGQPMLARQLQRVTRSRRIDKLVIATSIDPSDDSVATLAQSMAVAVYRGSLDDVLDRVYCAAAEWSPTWVVRLTGDCPLSDPELIDFVINEAVAGDVDYATNAAEPTWPDGLDVECMRFVALEEAWHEARLPSEREHVTPFIRKNARRFKTLSLRQDIDQSAMRWTVDEERDLAFVRAVYERLLPELREFTTADVIDLLIREPELSLMNNTISRNEGYARSLLEERPRP